MCLHRYIAHVGGGGLYPRPPFGAASRHRAAAIDAWVDFSAARVAHRFAASVESAQSARARSPIGLESDLLADSGVHGLHADSPLCKPVTPGGSYTQPYHQMLPKIGSAHAAPQFATSALQYRGIHIRLCSPCPNSLGFVWLQPADPARNPTQDLEAAKEQLLSDLAALDSHLQAQTFVVGDSPSLADVALVVDLRPAFEKVNKTVSCPALDRCCNASKHFSLLKFQTSNILIRLQRPIVCR